MIESLAQRAAKCAVGAALITIIVVGLQGSTGTGALQIPTYTKDIAPLLMERCGMCHVSGGPAPFSLLTYEDAKRHAAEIAAAARARSMPPWKADPDDGPFLGQQPL